MKTLKQYIIFWQMSDLFTKVDELTPEIMEKLGSFVQEYTTHVKPCYRYDVYKNGTVRRL